MDALFFFSELIILYFLSRLLTQELSSFLQRITRSKMLAMYLLALIFLPGTMVHELAHFLSAKILLVSAGKISLIPKNEGHELKMGSVMIAKTGLIRKLLIGTAPFVIGTTIILGTLYLALKNSFIGNFWVTLGIILIVFQIGNTMFSSRKDLEGSAWLLILMTILFIIIYTLGIKIPWDYLIQIPVLSLALEKAVFLLIIPIIIDFTVLILLKNVNH